MTTTRRGPGRLIVLLALVVAGLLLLGETGFAGGDPPEGSCGSWVVDRSQNAPGPGSTLLTGTDAVSAMDAWAVGYTVHQGAPDSTVAEHWDGVQWSVVPSANVPDALWSILYDVAVISPTDAWAVGTSVAPGLSSPLIEQWDGTAWSLVAGPAAGNSQLYGVDGLSPSDVWAVGYPYESGLRSPLIEHWDGAS